MPHVACTLTGVLEYCHKGVSARLARHSHNSTQPRAPFASQVVDAVPSAAASEGEVQHLAQFFTARLADWWVPGGGERGCWGRRLGWCGEQGWPRP